MTTISFDNVTKAFLRDDGSRHVVLANLCLEIANASFTTLMGPNGCGKSTLLNLIAGLEDPDAGTIMLTGVRGQKPQIGYVWQDYRSSLLPWLDVAENICFPLRIRGINKRERHQAASKVLAGLGSEIHANQSVYQLSGGQQQLVSILRGIVAQPDLLLLDEPFSALDQSTRWSMAIRTERLCLDRGIPAVFVSHDVDEAVMLGDVIILMSREGGRIVKSVLNPLPRPRHVKMLTSPEHVHCRDEIIDFLFKEGAIHE